MKKSLEGMKGFMLEWEGDSLYRVPCLNCGAVLWGGRIDVQVNDVLD
jgi:hypothetical protein